MDPAGDAPPPRRPLSEARGGGGDARRAVAGVVETLVARRLGRLFLVLAALLVTGGVRAVLADPDGRGLFLGVAAGALLAAASALAHGLRTVRRALGGSPRPWTGPLAAGGVPIWVYGLFVLAVGLRGLAILPAEGRLGAAAWAGITSVLGALVLRAWWRVGEVGKMVGVLGDLPGDDGA